MLVPILKNYTHKKSMGILSLSKLASVPVFCPSLRIFPLPRYKCWDMGFSICTSEPHGWPSSEGWRRCRPLDGFSAPLHLPLLWLKDVVDSSGVRCHLQRSAHDLDCSPRRHPNEQPQFGLKIKINWSHRLGSGHWPPTMCLVVGAIGLTSKVGIKFSHLHQNSMRNTLSTHLACPAYACSNGPICMEICKLFKIWDLSFIANTPVAWPFLGGEQPSQPKSRCYHVLRIK